MSVTQTSRGVASGAATALRCALRTNLANGHMEPISQVATIVVLDVPQIQQLAAATQPCPMTSSRNSAQRLSP